MQILTGVAPDLTWAAYITHTQYQDITHTHIYPPYLGYTHIYIHIYIQDITHTQTHSHALTHMCDVYVCVSARANVCKRFVCVCASVCVVRISVFLTGVWGLGFRVKGLGLRVKG